jgi:iron(III) transport system substrate-binding protein
VGPSVLLALELLLGVALGLLGTLVFVRRRSSPPLLTFAFVVTLALAVVPPALLGPRMSARPRRIRIVSVFDQPTTQALTEAFTRRTGILCDVDPFAGGTQTTAGLILQGRLHPDVLLGGTVEIHEELAQKQLLAPHQIRPDSRRTTLYDDPEGRWTPMYLGLLGLVYRPLPELQAHAPDWLTLIQPRFKNRVSIPAPDKSGGGLVFLATQLQRQDEIEKSWEYLKLLDENEVHWEDRSSVPISRVAAGTMDLGVAWAHDVLRRIESERLPVKLTIPRETGYEVGAASILAGATDLEACQRFLDFLTGREAAKIQVEVGHRVPLRTDIDLPGYLDHSLPDLKTGSGGMHYDRAFVVKNRDAWIQRWKAMRDES